MTREEAGERIELLRRQIAENARLYYEQDAPVISDYEYDRMFRELGDLEAAYPEFDSPTSPTKRVGGRALDKFEKVVHTVRMDSLTDVFSYEELSEAKKHPVIIHYAGKPGKPWRRKHIPDDYKEYMNKIPKSLKKFTFRDLRKRLFSKV